MQNRKWCAVRWLLCILMCIGATTYIFGQDTNASLTGTVTDSTGAAVPSVSLTLTNQVTQFKLKIVSNDAGEYTFANVPPGKYDLNATANGFQSVTQKGIELAATQQGRVNVQLSLGNVEQNVTVTAEASQINYVDPTVGGGVAPETLQDFPLTVSGAPRSSVTVADMLPGVSTGASGNAYNTRINGGLVSGDEAMVDGATAMEGYMNQSGMVSLETDFGMSPDITSEVHVLTANYDAQYGNSTSGQLIIVTRSGGDQFHGAAYEYARNDMFNATQWGASKKPADKENDYGANVGGPILFPGLLHRDSGRVKGYFYFNWEAFKEAGGANSATLSIPSLAARNGNFAGAGTQLYYPDDPAKYGADAGQPIAYGGVMNQINPAYEDPVAKAWMAALPTPTNSGEINNYFIPKAGQGSLTANENVYFGRVDMNVGQKDHFFWTTWWQRSGTNTQTNLPVDISTASPANPENANIQRLNWEHNFSGNMTNHATIGYLNRNESYYALNGHANLPTVPGVADTTFLPQMNFGGGYTQLGNSAVPNPGQAKTTRGTWAFNDVFTRIIGSHTINAGFEWRFAGTSIHQGTNQGGTFSFAADTTGNQGCSQTNPCPGDAAASFYLGAVSNASVSYYNVFAEYPRQEAWALHVGDSWRVMPKLTVDYSLRWDYIQPFREKYNNLSFFDPNGLNPGAVRADGSELKGRLAFAGKGFGEASYGAPYPEIPFKKGFAPRLGFAYTINDKTVVRAGYGIYFGQAFYPGWSGGMSQDGFNKTVNLNERSLGNLKVPALYLTSGISPDQVGPTKNISSSFDNGQQPSLYRPLDGNRRPYSSQWNLTIEHQFPQNFTATLSYVGTQGAHLPSQLSPLNVLNPNDPAIKSIGSDLAVNYNDADGPATFAAHGVSVPYVGWQSQMTGCAPTLAQALLPYPQFCGNLQGLNEGHATSSYHSLQLGVNRRAHNGLFVLGSFTYSKLMTNASDSTQSGGSSGLGNSGNFSPYNTTSRDYALAPDNVPITAQVSLVYDLPFGHNKRYLNHDGVMNVFVGGWQVSPLYHYEYGTPLWFSSSSCPTSSLTGAFRQSCIPGVLPGQKPYVHGRNGFNPHTDGKYLNPAAFETNFSQFGYTGFGSAVSNIYGSSFQDTDIAFTKNTKITERVNFKFMSNFFNAFNNHYFVSQGNGPALPFVTDVAASGNSFGTWNGTVSNPRTIQFAGRIEF